MTHRVSEREQGELRGAIQSLRSIAFVIRPLLFSGIFAWFINRNIRFIFLARRIIWPPYWLFAAMLLATRVEQPQLGEAQRETNRANRGPYRPTKLVQPPSRRLSIRRKKILEQSRCMRD